MKFIKPPSHLEIFKLKLCKVSRELELNTEDCTHLKDLNVHMGFDTSINFKPPKVALEAPCLRNLNLNCNLVNPKCFKNLVTNLDVLALPWHDIFSYRTFASEAPNFHTQHRQLDFSLNECPKGLQITDPASEFTLYCKLPIGNGTFKIVSTFKKKYPRIPQIFVLDPKESIIVPVDLKCLDAIEERVD